MTQSAHWAQSQDTAATAAQSANLWAAPSIKIALTLVAFFNSGNFGGDIVPGSEESNFQQYVGLALWIAITALSYFRRPVLTFRLSAGLACGLAFYALAVLSAVWSPMPAASYQKALALGIVTFGAYRLVRSLPFQDIIECLLHGLAALCVLSIVAALFFPSIGIDSNYQHSGLARGSK